MPHIVNSDDCISCGSCVNTCPVSAIALSDETGYAEVDQTLCIDCGACEGACPTGAIRAE